MTYLCFIGHRPLLCHIIYYYFSQHRVKTSWLLDGSSYVCVVSEGVNKSGPSAAFFQDLEQRCPKLCLLHLSNVDLREPLPASVEFLTLSESSLSPSGWRRLASTQNHRRCRVWEKSSCGRWRSVKAQWRPCPRAWNVWGSWTPDCHKVASSLILCNRRSSLRHGWPSSTSQAVTVQSWRSGKPRQPGRTWPRWSSTNADLVRL